MTGFDDRKKAEEKRFSHAHEMQFKARARCSKMFGLWVADKIGLNDVEAEAYAAKLVGFSFVDSSNDALFKVVKTDLVKNGVDHSDRQLAVKFAELEQMAIQQLKVEV